MKNPLILVAFIGIATAMNAGAADAKELYGSQCAKCHGADGKGQTAMGKKLAVRDYTDAKVQESITDEAAFKAIKVGVKKDGKTLMKAFEDLTDEEIKALVGHIRAFKK